MTLSEELIWRGFVKQTTIQDLKQLDEGPRTFYHGFDASADSQAIGNLAAMMCDMTFMRHGYKGVLLAGGATTLIGDPGGKESEREMQAIEAIEYNVARAQKQLETIFNGQDFTLVNNLDWTKNMTVLDFLRDIGKHFNMTSLVQRDYIANRIGEGASGISYTEFSYTLLQGMDYLHLFDTQGVTLQLGGSDQWGNCLSGVDLVRKARGATVDAMTLPLVINKATGKKFGKSEEGAIWLDAEKTSIYKFYQFWLNIDDLSVVDYMKVFTMLSKEEVDGIETAHLADPRARIAQHRLAQEVTKIVHGVDKTASAERVTDVLFGGTDFTDLNDDDIETLAQEIPTALAGTSLISTLVDAGVAASNGEAKRLIDGAAISLNGEKVSADLVVADTTLIKKGKNTFILVR